MKNENCYMGRRVYLLFAFGIVLALMVAGCRSQKGVVKNDGPNVTVKPDTTEETVVRLDTIRNAVYERYSANFSCEIEGFTVNGQIRIVHDSCIWISINKIIEVGRVMITPTRVSGYSRVLDKYYDGTYEEVRKRWGIDVDYATIEAMIVGNCPPNCKRSKEPERKGEHVTLWYDQGKRKVTMTKDYATKLLTSTLLSIATPKMQVKCVYSDRTASSGQMMPGAVEVSVSTTGINKKTKLTLSKITLGKVQKTPFEMPKGLKKI